MSDLNQLLMDREALMQCIVQQMTALMQDTYTLNIGDSISLHRFDQSVPCSGTCLYKPMLSFMVRGHKTCILGKRTIHYESGDLFITGLDIPAQFQVSNPSPDRPGFSVAFILKPDILQEVIEQLPPLPDYELCECDSCTLSDQATASELLTLYRILDMYQRGQYNDLLGNLIVKELYSLVLTSCHGMELRRLSTAGAQSSKIAKVIHYIRDNYRSDIDIEALADMAYMAVPTFYKHFKQATSLSPLQYLKRMRLYEAKRLMLNEALSASAAGYEVGYVSEQHFSRDYKKLFGRPPLQDVRV